MKIISTGQILFEIMNYQGFQNSQVNLYEFSSFGCKSKLKFEMLQNFELLSFKLTKFCSV
jgi:heme oxygenase